MICRKISESEAGFPISSLLGGDGLAYIVALVQRPVWMEGEAFIGTGGNNAAVAAYGGIAVPTYSLAAGGLASEGR